MPFNKDAAIQSVLSNRLVRCVTGGFVTTASFRIATGVKSPFILGLIFVASAGYVMESGNAKAKVPSGDNGAGTTEQS